jgi:hypothetical protein
MIPVTCTPTGRQVTCEDSPAGWPQDPAMTRTRRNDEDDNSLTIGRNPR